MTTDDTSGYQRIIFLIPALLIIVGIGFFIFRNWDKGQTIEILIPTPTTVAEIKVYISGAVREPGVYALKDGDRTEQAIIAAGGFNGDAQQDGINLAARVKDEQHIRVPRVGEALPLPVGSSEVPKKININTASANLLDTLPGIGEVRSKNIIDYRDKNGPFKRIEDLRDLKLIPTSTFDSIKNLITAE